MPEMGNTVNVKACRSKEWILRVRTALAAVGAEYDFQVQSGPDTVPVRGCVVWSRLDRTMHTHDGDILPIYRAGIEAASASIPGLERVLERQGARLS